MIIQKKNTCEFIYKGEKPILEEFKVWMQKENITKDNSCNIIEQAKCLIAQNFKPTKNSLKNKNSKLFDICNKILEYFNLQE